jgi:hypothetical protein
MAHPWFFIMALWLFLTAITSERSNLGLPHSQPIIPPLVQEGIQLKGFSEMT